MDDKTSFLSILTITFLYSTTASPKTFFSFHSLYLHFQHVGHKMVQLGLFSFHHGWDENPRQLGCTDPGPLKGHSTK